jgi:hypothetical protein
MVVSRAFKPSLFLPHNEVLAGILAYRDRIRDMIYDWLSTVEFWKCFSHSLELDYEVIELCNFYHHAS